MSRSDAWCDNVAPCQYVIPLPEIPGIVEGWMTVYPGVAGSVSFRVIVGVGEGQTAKHDLLEFVISAENATELVHALMCRGTRIAREDDPLSSFPCHVGSCTDAGTGTA
jgi:hypothetical protein